MKIETVITKVHTATFSADDIKAVALSAVKGQVGVEDTAVASSDVTMDSDGSLKVEIVENVPAAPKADEAPTSDAADKAAPAVTIPMTLTGATA